VASQDGDRLGELKSTEAGRPGPSPAAVRPGTLIVAVCAQLIDELKDQVRPTIRVGRNRARPARQRFNVVRLYTASRRNPGTTIQRRTKRRHGDQEGGIGPL